MYGAWRGMAEAYRALDDTERAAALDAKADALYARFVSRQEDIGSVTTPLLFLLFIPFYTTMFLVPNDPDTTLVRVLSQIPIFAPFMMPVRDAFGALEPLEMPLALAIAAATIPGLVWLAARVYQRGVLHTGGRMKLSEALRSR